MNLEMHREEIDRLLDLPHVGVLSIAAGDGAAPLSTPLWFAHVDERDESLRRRIAARYVPPGALEDFLSQTESADVVTLHMRPARFRSADLTRTA